MNKLRSIMSGYKWIEVILISLLVVFMISVMALITQRPLQLPSPLSMVATINKDEQIICAPPTVSQGQDRGDTGNVDTDPVGN